MPEPRAAVGAEDHEVVAALPRLADDLPRRGAGEDLRLQGEVRSLRGLRGETPVRSSASPPPTAASGEAFRIDGLPEDALRRIRGRRIGAIFQDPLTSLNPLYTVSRQLVETIRTHLDATPTEARRRAVELLQQLALLVPQLGGLFRREAARRERQTRSGGKVVDRPNSDRC